MTKYDKISPNQVVFNKNKKKNKKKKQKEKQKI